MEAVELVGDRVRLNTRAEVWMSLRTALTLVSLLALEAARRR